MCKSSYLHLGVSQHIIKSLKCVAVKVWTNEHHEISILLNLHFPVNPAQKPGTVAVSLWISAMALLWDQPHTVGSRRDPCSPGRGHCSSISNLNLVSSALYIQQLLSSQILSPARSQLERSINKGSSSSSWPKAAMQEAPDVPDILHPTATGAIQLESHKITSNKALEQK